jgi:hypothetical protein
MDGKNKQMDDNALEKITGGVGNINIEGGDGTDLPQFPEMPSVTPGWENPAKPKDVPGSLNGIGRSTKRRA